MLLLFEETGGLTQYYMMWFGSLNLQKLRSWFRK